MSADTDMAAVAERFLDLWQKNWLRWSSAGPAIGQPSEDAGDGRPVAGAEGDGRDGD